MAYNATRNGDELEQAQSQARNNNNNTKNIRNAASVAATFGVPHAKGVQVADRLSHGKASEILGKGLTAVNRIVPGGGIIQYASNELSESGVSDVAGSAAEIKNRTNSRSGGEGQSLPSSVCPSTTTEGISRKSSLDDSSENDNKDENQKAGGSGSFFTSKVAKIVIILLLPVFLLFLAFFFVIASITNIIGDFEDAIGINEITGGETGDISFTAGTSEQAEFYNRVNTLKLRYQAQGKYVDTLKIIAVFHVLERNGANIDYNKMDVGKLDEIANSMFEGNIYSESTFKNNLISFIIPKYLPNSSQKAKEEIVDEIFKYVDDYYDLIEKEAPTYSCSNNGSCSYDIKGFYIKGRGNVSQKIDISDLYVRLMQCGTADGHNYGGTFGQALYGEELVPFEKYILGVAYQEIGPDSPAEAIKAQMVAARSYILARPLDMGGWRTLKQENGRWVLQVASCTQDQVYCDPDRGCSSNDGQWGQVHSGLSYNTGFSRAPMAADSLLRIYASQTQGELLVNSQGYVVYAGYKQEEQNQFSALAKQGLNYKQILLQVYNQGTRNYGAANIQKSSCSGGKSNCVSSGEYVNWRQYSEPWASVKVGTSGNTIKGIGCLATSIAILIQKSGVQTNIENFNPGTFVEKLNVNDGFDGGLLKWGAVSRVVPSFQYVNSVSLSSALTKEQKFNKIREIVSVPGVYAVLEVSNGGHWVAVDSIDGNNVRMIDPGTNEVDLWSRYNYNTVKSIVYFKAV